MFRIVNRLIQWTGKYKRRIYIGFVYAFIHSIFTAIPIMLAAKGLGLFFPVGGNPAVGGSSQHHELL